MLFKVSYNSRILEPFNIGWEWMLSQPGIRAAHQIFQLDLSFTDTLCTGVTGYKAAVFGYIPVLLNLWYRTLCKELDTAVWETQIFA